MPPTFAVLLVQWIYCRPVKSCKVLAVSLRAALARVGCVFGLIMRDIANKMAELKFEAPLAQFEETDDWGSVEFQSNNAKTINDNNIDAINLNNIKNNMKDRACDLDVMLMKSDSNILNDNDCINNLKNDNIVKPRLDNAGAVSDNFNETFSGSLEDLVNTFDDKITKCFGNYEESVEKLAPVQVRTQEEIMNECQ